jgi:hypothetical protein
MIHMLAALWHINLKWLIQNWSQGHRDSTKPTVHTLRVELKNEAERKDGHRLNRILQKHTTKNLLQGQENTCWCWGKPWMVSTTGERNVRAKALAMWSICTWNNNIHVMQICLRLGELPRNKLCTVHHHHQQISHDKKPYQILVQNWACSLAVLQCLVLFCRTSRISLICTLFSNLSF